MRLILMRHGDAEGAKGRGDHARPLSAAGARESAAAGRTLKARFDPGLALVSDSARTLETFARVAEAFDPPPRHRALPVLYAASPEAILAVLGELPAALRTVLVIGHNPGIGDLARGLAAEGDPGALAALGAHFPTACVAALRLDAPSWAELRPGRLEWLHGAKAPEGEAPRAEAP